MNIEIYYHRFEAAQVALRIANKLGQPFRGKALGFYSKHKSLLTHAQNGTKPAKRYMEDFKATIGGINCGVAVTFYASEDKSTGWPMQADFRLINEGGYPMEFLEAKMTQRERANIESHIIESQRGRR